MLSINMNFLIAPWALTSDLGLLATASQTYSMPKLQVYVNLFKQGSVQYRYIDKLPMPSALPLLYAVNNEDFNIDVWQMFCELARLRIANYPSVCSSICVFLSEISCLDYISYSCTPLPDKLSAENPSNISILRGHPGFWMANCCMSCPH